MYLKRLKMYKVGMMNVVFVLRDLMFQVEYWLICGECKNAIHDDCWRVYTVGYMRKDG